MDRLDLVNELTTATRHIEKAMNCLADHPSDQTEALQVYLKMQRLLADIGRLARVANEKPTV